jgi:methylated-DNA-[protein]-cysteine S-methyltransferase
MTVGVAVLVKLPPPASLDSRPAEVWHPRGERSRTRLPQLSLHTPIGDVTVSEEDGALVSLDWGWGRDQTETPLLCRARDQLHAYFDGVLTEFDLPLAPEGTPYRRRVWQALCDIPYGATRTYAELAAAAGGSARSVGQANGRNPIPIIIPCHRVVAATHLGGYSGGDGLETKRYLLSLESAAPHAGHPPRMLADNRLP